MGNRQEEQKKQDNQPCHRTGSLHFLSRVGRVHCNCRCLSSTEPLRLKPKSEDYSRKTKFTDKALVVVEL